MSVSNQTLAVVAICGLFGACASQPKPNDAVARAQTMIDQAEKGGAQRYAAADLQQARDKLQEANTASDHGNQVDARRLADESALDAELASARERSGEEQQAANQVQVGNDTLKQEADRDANKPQPNGQ